MKKMIVCDHCRREITFRGDLSVVLVSPTIHPYHDECFSKENKGFSGIFLSDTVINGFGFSFMAIVSFILSITLFITSEQNQKWLALFLLIVPIYRLVSYLLFERHLEK
ncbi:MAG: hypothetical protein K0R71_942 [Bacillales bacterium]|nr:hypothetical protein [Bacillales bacterium]